MDTRRRRPSHHGAAIFLLLLFHFHCVDPESSARQAGLSDGVGALVTPTGGIVNGNATVPEGGCGASGAGEPQRLASLEEPCGELTGAKVLQFVNAEYQATLGMQGLYPVTPLSIRLQYRGGEILCYPGETAPPGTARPDVPPSVSVSVEIRFVGEDGAFDETFQAPVTGGWSDASFCYSTEPDRLSGRFDPTTDDDGEVARITFNGSFAGPRCWGLIAASRQRGGFAPESIPIAYWGSAN